MLKILRRALEGWDALEPDLAEAAGPGMALPEGARSSSRSATQAIVDALVDIAGAKSGAGAGLGHVRSENGDRSQDDEGMVAAHSSTLPAQEGNLGLDLFGPHC